MSRPPLDPRGERSADGFLLVGDVLCCVCVRPVPRADALRVLGPSGEERAGHRECLKERKER